MVETTNMKTQDTPHTIVKLSGIPLLDAMPEKRKSEWAAHAISRLQHGIEGQPTAAYETLANLGLLERTRNGYRNIDGGAIIRRCREGITMLASYL